MAEVASLWKLDILHVHYAIPHATCAFLAKQIIRGNAPKIVTTLHGTDITLVGNDKSFFEITKFSIEQSEGITAVSQYLSERTKKEFVIGKDIGVIPNFVDAEKFKPGDSIGKKKFAPQNQKILMHISNFRPVKRIGDVIKVFDLIQKEIPAVLIMIGEGPDLPWAVELTQELNLKDKVIFLGTQDFVENLLPLADLFLLPSQNESFGLVALEALSCGVPVIATNTGGLPEVVENGKCGYLADLGDVEFMAEKGIGLLRDQDKFLKFKDCARKTAKEKFDCQIIVPLYEKFYKMILEK
jgi:N-acetyl-alpha-D-glucosaminyl L-malate synthase BshA